MRMCSCGKRLVEEGRDCCFTCRVKTVGFTWRGGGGYTKHSFHERTNQEFLLEHVGGTEKELAKREDVMKADP